MMLQKGRAAWRNRVTWCTRVWEVPATSEGPVYQGSKETDISGQRPGDGAVASAAQLSLEWISLYKVIKE